MGDGEEGRKEGGGRKGGRKRGGKGEEGKTNCFKLTKYCLERTECLIILFIK